MSIIVNAAKFFPSQTKIRTGYTRCRIVHVSLLTELCQMLLVEGIDSLRQSALLLKMITAKTLIIIYAIRLICITVSFHIKFLYTDFYILFSCLHITFHQFFYK